MIGIIFTAASRRTADAPKWPTTALTVALFPMLLASCDQRKEPVGPRSPAGPAFTLSSGSASTLVGRASFSDGFKVKRKTGDWKVSVDSDPLDIAVQTIVFQPGGQSGWHRHPGPVFILVVQGEMTFYESDDPDCKPIIRHAGQAYLDAGEHAHIARNETQAEARNVVTYFAPPGAALRIDAPDPGNCPFSQ
jgi:quercetin dioxygenase-like cupin family protein